MYNKYAFVDSRLMEVKHWRLHAEKFVNNVDCSLKVPVSTRDSCLLRFVSSNDDREIGKHINMRPTRLEETKTLDYIITA